MHIAWYNVIKGQRSGINNSNQVPHLNQVTTWESDNTQVNITNESQVVSPFPVG